MKIACYRIAYYFHASLLIVKLTPSFSFLLVLSGQLGVGDRRRQHHTIEPLSVEYWYVYVKCFQVSGMYRDLVFLWWLLLWLAKGIGLCWFVIYSHEMWLIMILACNPIYPWYVLMSCDVVMWLCLFTTYEKYMACVHDECLRTVRGGHGHGMIVWYGNKLLVPWTWMLMYKLITIT